MQAAWLVHDSNCLMFLGSSSLWLRQTACDIDEHAVDAASGRCRHGVAGGHVDRQLRYYTIYVRTAGHVRRHTVRATAAQEVNWWHACAVWCGDSHVVDYRRQRQPVVDGVADDNGGWLFVVVGRQWCVALYACRVPQLQLNTAINTYLSTALRQICLQSCCLHYVDRSKLPAASTVRKMRSRCYPRVSDMY